MLRHWLWRGRCITKSALFPRIGSMIQEALLSFPVTYYLCLRSRKFDGIYRVSAAGGQASRLTEFDASRQQYSHLWPYFLPDGRHFLYLGRSRKKEYNGIYGGSLDSRDSKFLFQADSGAAYAPPGYILYVSGQALVASTSIR